MTDFETYTTYPTSGNQGDEIDPMIAELWMDATGRGAPVAPEEIHGTEGGRTIYAAAPQDTLGRAVALIFNSGEEMSLSVAMGQVQPAHGIRSTYFPEHIDYEMELATLREQARARIAECL